MAYAAGSRPREDVAQYRSVAEANEDRATRSGPEQAGAALNAGVFLELSARAYDYTGDGDALRRRLPVLRRMIAFVDARRRYTRDRFPADDPRHGLIWGSAEADNGSPDDDTPDSHPYYYQNAAWIWRGLAEHARCLEAAGKQLSDPALAAEAKRAADIARELRSDTERSLRRTLDERNPQLKAAGITPITAFDIRRKPSDLTSYENHRYIMDWWTADWGVPDLDAGHFRHRTAAGLEIIGMNVATDNIYGVDSGASRRTCTTSLGWRAMNGCSG